MTELNQSANTWTMYYNQRGLLTDETLAIDGHFFDISYAYNNAGQRKSTTWPDNRSITLAPDTFGRPTQLGSYAYNITYGRTGASTHLVYGNGVMADRSYNSRGLLDTLGYQHGDTDLVTRSLAYDANDNPLTITDHRSVRASSCGASDSIFCDGFERPLSHTVTRTRSYQFDALDRLRSVSISTLGTRHFQYDPLGNLRRRHGSAPGPAIDYSYDSRNRLTNLSLNMPFGYDGRGNVTSFGPASLAYNHGNELVSYQLSSANRDQRYSYDARGWRVKISDHGDPTYALHDANHRLVARWHNGQWTDFIHLKGRPISRIEGAATHYIHTNYQRSPLLETDPAGSITRKPLYYFYGMTDDGKSAIPAYAGSPMSPVTDLSYMGARYYMPVTGRFLASDPASLDPTSPVGLNRYVYANDNPVRFVDPDGRQSRAGLRQDQWNRAYLSGEMSKEELKANRAASAKGAMTGAGVVTGVEGVFGAAAAVKVVARAVAAKAVRKVVVKGGEQAKTVIGRIDNATNEVKGISSGERSLLRHLPDRGSPKANWKQNAGVLRREMSKGKPIRDTTPGDNSGQFLNAERNLLRERSWTFDSSTNYWHSPEI